MQRIYVMRDCIDPVLDSTLCKRLGNPSGHQAARLIYMSFGVGPNTATMHNSAQAIDKT